MTVLKPTLVKKICAVVCSAAVFSASAQILPPPPEVNAKGYILVDFTTGKVLADGNADSKLAPASLTKMMTSYVIGTEILAGNISPTDMVTVSNKAWAKNFPGSSVMFIEVGKQISVDELNHGVIIQSGNDACVALAEHIAGTESAFADLMNAHAEKLGMTNSHFINSHGLDTNEHYTTPRDMATLGAALIRDVPDEYAIYSQKSFTYNGIKQYNRNSLLWDASLDVDGIKTGHTSEAGYSLVSSAKKDDMRLIAVVMGTESERARKDESKKLLNYGFRFYETITPYKAGDSFAKQRIWMGDKEEVSLGILQDTPITIPRGQRKNLKATFELDKTLEAPIAKGTKVGTLFLQLEGEEIANYPLVTLEEVAEGSFFSKIYDYLRLQIMQ
ncbi:serine hydrolase [Pseudoalteromonas xiamenensis]|uniref:serine-type D-Ala-D-Ala carboxypeptidase n=1 Tax=Pseudoalteromonas xiamenensis TaxID=882626 RepID=A0A975DIC1_9GAMM|nr:serine hydrolase [Pseudoalteromonas xiamenensis]QTH72094.1 serine hydrolase [Pseudoalteromonas xiamenensis]